MCRHCLSAQPLLGQARSRSNSPSLSPWPAHPPACRDTGSPASAAPRSLQSAPRRSCRYLRTPLACHRQEMGYVPLHPSTGSGLEHGPAGACAPSTSPPERGGISIAPSACPLPVGEGSGWGFHANADARLRLAPPPLAPPRPSTGSG